jgi:hypothetical protein
VTTLAQPFRAKMAPAALPDIVAAPSPGRTSQVCPLAFSKLKAVIGTNYS